MSRSDRSISQRLDRAGSIEAKRETLLEWIDDLHAEQKLHNGRALRASIALARLVCVDSQEHDPGHHLIAAAVSLEKRINALRRIIDRIEVLK